MNDQYQNEFLNISDKVAIIMKQISCRCKLLGKKCSDKDSGCPCKEKECQINKCICDHKKCQIM